ncbi:hypothetical protein KR200_009081 [Drosophila serrata]|nr:hypothetical protein KR200_009081 [Drosophila serrata]
MPRKVKTRRQRKSDTVKKNAAKEEQKNHLGRKSSNLERRVNIDENLAEHINRSPLVSTAEQEEEVTITSCDEFVQKKEAHQLGGTPKGTPNAWEVGNALDKEESSSTDSISTIDEDELLHQIWKDLDEIFCPTDEKVVPKGSLSPNFAVVQQFDNLVTCAKLVKKKTALPPGGTPDKTRNVWKLGNDLDKDEEQHSSSPIFSFDQAKLDQILKDLDDILRPSNEAVANGGLSPDVQWDKQSDSLESSDIIDGNMATHINRPSLVPTSEQKEELTLKNWELGNSLDKNEEQYSSYDAVSTTDEAELDQLWTDLHEINPQSDEAVANVKWENQSDNLKSTAILDRNLPKHTKQPPLVALSKGMKNEANNCKKKKTHHSSGTPKGTGTIDKVELLDQIYKDMYEIFPSSDKAVIKGVIFPNVDCSTSGDSGPVPPKFFGNSGYFMLTGTDSQLQHQLKDLASCNIFVESCVELPDALADIVEQQMTCLVQNRDPILAKMRDKYNLLEPRRVPRQKKHRKFPKKTEN